MSIRGYASIAGLVLLGLSLWAWLPWGEISAWATNQQRGFQNSMASALRSIRNGEPLAVWTLCAATAAYGFVHALGPGHGKVLLGGAALASGATLRRLSVLTLLSSLAQAGVAIALVGGLAFAFRLGSQDLVDVTETWLAPISYGAIAAIGGILIYRGLRAWLRIRQSGPATPCAHCGHAHGPRMEEVETLRTRSDALALIASIAIRPCTGALFVLVIAARFDAFWTGALAVVTMGLGTAAFNLAVAGSGFAARNLARMGTGQGRGFAVVSAALHVLGGLFISGLSLVLMLPYLG